MKVFLLALIVSVAWAQPASAQSGQAAQPPGPPSPAASGPTPPANFAYEPDGRRDPFVSLVRRGTDPRGDARAPRPEGLPGLGVDEVAVRGILESRGGYVAMIAAPSGRTYTVRPGDRLMDGSVRAISAQTVVFTQEVSDPLSLKKQREVRKPLRGEVK